MKVGYRVVTLKCHSERGEKISLRGKGVAIWGKRAWDWQESKNTAVELSPTAVLTSFVLVALFSHSYPGLSFPPCCSRSNANKPKNHCQTVPTQQKCLGQIRSLQYLIHRLVLIAPKRSRLPILAHLYCQNSPPDHPH